MSLHTGIEPSKEIDVSELNIPTKKYVDDQDNLKLAKSGGTLTGGLSMDDNKITDLGTPTANTHASTKKYVDDQAALKLDLAGGQMTGPLSLNGDRLWDVADPTLDTNAANKRYVDNKAATLQTSINSKLTKWGGDMTGELDMGDNKITDLADPTNNDDTANKKYVDDKFNSVPAQTDFMMFVFPSVSKNTYTQSRNTSGYLFWTNDRDVKITLLCHVFDDDNSITSAMSFYYRIFYWNKTRVRKQKLLSKTNVAESTKIVGTWLQTFELGLSTTITDVSCFTMEFKYVYSANLGNENAVHCLIEYV